MLTSLVAPSSGAHPTGQDAPEAVAVPEDEGWVEKEWKKFQGAIRE